MIIKIMYEQCIQHIKDHVMLNFEKDLIIDPNADGKNVEFMESIMSLSKMVLFYNKNPDGTDDTIMPMDFTQVNFDKFNRTMLSGLWYDAVHIVSQPPPGEANQYIKAACKFAESVSFILPKDAHYAFPLSYQCLFSTDLPGHKQEPDLIFQIWMKADY